MAKTTAVTKKNDALPTAIAELFGSDAGAGLDQMGKDDLAIPFIGLIQSLSPQRKKSDAKFIEGAQEGMLFNSVTNALYDAEGEGVRVIPCGFAKKYLEFIPRDAGGGFVASYDNKQDAYEQAKPGNQVVEVAEHYVLIQGSDGTWSQALLSMKSSQLRVSRNWNSRQQMLKVDVGGGRRITPPIYGTIYRLRTVEESNDRGTWYNYKVDFEGIVSDPELYAEGKSFFEVAQVASARGQDYGRAEGKEQEAEATDDGNPEF